MKIIQHYHNLENKIRPKSLPSLVDETSTDKFLQMLKVYAYKLMGITIAKTYATRAIIQSAESIFLVKYQLKIQKRRVYKVFMGNTSIYT